MTELSVKTGGIWRLRVQYQDGQLRFGLQSQEGKGHFGMNNDMWLTAEEWDRLVKWVEFERANERVRQEVATP